MTPANLVLMKLAGVLVFIGIIFGLGWETSSVYSAHKLDQLKLNHKTAMAEATEAKDAAETKVTALEQNYTAKLGIATTTFEETRQNEKATADRTIANLNAAVTSLRVSTSHRPAGSGALPGIAATACSSNGPATETLSPAVAGRLARRYADYNEIVDELDLCQATVTTDRLK